MLSSLVFLVSLRFTHQAPSGLANRWVLVIRHGEKPATGPELTAAGQARAKAYVAYFTHFKSTTGQPIKLGRLIATEDSKSSWRERLTLEPLSQATGIPLEMGFKNKQVAELVQSLKVAGGRPGNILICWHHGQIPNMLTAFGGDAAQLIGAEKWPNNHFDWVIQLHFDSDGNLIPKDSAKIVEPKFAAGG